MPQEESQSEGGTQLAVSEFGDTEGLSRIELQRHVRRLLRAAEGNWNPERTEALLEHLQNLALNNKMPEREQVRLAEHYERIKKNHADTTLRALEIEAANERHDPLIMPIDTPATVGGPVQVNVFMPSNERGPTIDVNTNGHSTNGKH